VIDKKHDGIVRVDVTHNFFLDLEFNKKGFMGVAPDAFFL